jgi:plasmid stabilization system protein ParE
MNCRFSDAAAEELEEAFDFYNQRNASLGEDFLLEVMRGVQRITESPFKWSMIRPGIRKYRIDRFNYGLIYSPE